MAPSLCAIVIGATSIQDPYSWFLPLGSLRVTVRFTPQQADQRLECTREVVIAVVAPQGQQLGLLKALDVVHVKRDRGGASDGAQGVDAARRS
jgi:hypothetical protein